jgi:hypothetical protein
MTTRTLFLIVLSGFMLLACERSRGVYAGNDEYQPQPAPKGEIEITSHAMRGELARVDTAAKTVAIRLENGIVQTFTFDDNTSVRGLEKSGKSSNSAVRSLVGKEGSEVTVDWKDRSGSKMATNIQVTQLSTAKNLRHNRVY